MAIDYQELFERGAAGAPLTNEQKRDIAILKTAMAIDYIAVLRTAMAIDYQERCERGAAGAPLTNEQKRVIAMLARKAWEHYGRPGATTGKATAAFEAWRHMQDGEACGKQSLRAAVNGDYLALKAHYLMILGQTERAETLQARSACEPERWARAKLRQECREVADVIERPLAYVASIARCKFKTADLESLSRRQVWTLIFDIRRAAQKRRQHVEGVPF